MRIKNWGRRIKRFGSVAIQLLIGIPALIFQSLIGPIIIYFIVKQPVRQSLEACDPHALQPEIQNLFLHTLRELELEGFELVSYNVNHGQALWGMANDTYFVVLKNRRNRDMGAVMWPQNLPAFVEFSTEYTHKGERRLIETNNNPHIGPFHQLPSKHTYRFPHIHSLRRLYWLHRVMVQRHTPEAKIIFPKDGAELEMIQKTGERDLHGQAAFGYVSFRPSRHVYRLTWKGAWLMTWKQIGPIQTSLQKGVAWRERALLHQIVADQLHLTDQEKLPKPHSISSLLHTVNQRYWIGREHLANALRAIPHRQMITPLIEALEEDDGLLREVARECLEGLQDPLIDLLIRTMLTGSTGTLQQQAAYLLRPLAVIDTVVLGQHRPGGSSIQMNDRASPQTHKEKMEIAKRPQRVLENPDVSRCTTALPDLQRIVVYLSTADVYEIERFLTYSLNYIGRRHLKTHVSVHVYGNPETLHVNLANNFRSLCKNVFTMQPIPQEHEEKTKNLREARENH